jgi:hypothetical protein
MSFNDIILTNKRKDNFDLFNFNQNFEDTALMSKISTNSEEICINKNEIKNYSFINKTLVGNINYLNRDADNYVDPFQNSTARISLVILIDKFSKQILVLKTTGKHKFFIPGGYPKIFESSEHAAIRLFQRLTGIIIDDTKITRLQYLTENNMPTMCTYLSLVCDEVSYQNKNKQCQWIPINHLKTFNDKYFQKYYNYLYNAILQYIY